MRAPTLMKLMTVVPGIALLVSCAPSQTEAPPPSVVEALAAGNYSLVDLSHPYYEGAPEFVAPPHLGQGVLFKKTEIARWDERGANTWYWNWYQMTEHAGTHTDAPNHWFSGKDKESIDEIPIDRLVAPAVVVDVKAKAAADPDYMLSVDDLNAWEEAHGEIPPGAIVIMNSGWGEKYSDLKAFLGLDEAGGLHFPGFSPDAARWLLESRDINALASDSLATDALGVSMGTDPPHQVHIEMHRAGKYQIEMIANLDALPAAGAWLVVAPMKFQGGGGAGSRIFGILP